MTNVLKSTENQFIKYAEFYYSMGFNVTCITNYRTEYNKDEKNIAKSSYHKWEQLYKERQTKEELLSYDWVNATGIGVVLGSDYGLSKLAYPQIPKQGTIGYDYRVLLSEGVPEYNQGHAWHIIT